MGIEWRSVHGYEDLYEISNFGVIKNKKTGKTRSAYTTKMGYKRIGLSKDNKVVQHLIHRLVMASFVGPSELEVNHLDGVRDNNNLSNLEYCTKKENAQHSWKYLGRKARDQRGIKNPSNKLTPEIVLEIYNDSEKTNQELADTYNISRSNVTLIKNGKRWKHLTQENEDELHETNTSIEEGTTN